MTWVPNLFQEDCNGSGFRQFPFLVTEEFVGYGQLSLSVFVRGFKHWISGGLILSLFT